MNNIKEKNILSKPFNDFLDGLKKTFIETPMDFGSFLARVSGYRDYQLGNISIMDLEKPEQKQALLELQAIFKTLTNEDSLKIVGKALWEDMQERPAYYVGSILSGMKMSGTLAKIDDIYLLRGAYFTSTATAKMDSATNEQFENIKDILKMSDYEFNRYVEKTINNIDTIKTDESSILGYIKEAGLKKQPTEQEIKDEVDKKLREYIHENGVTSFQNISQFMDKTREELKNGTIKIETKKQNLKEQILEEPKEESYNSQVYRK